MSVFTDRTRESSTTTGTGAFTLSGTAPAGYQTFAAAGLNGLTVDYCIEAVDANGTPTGDWEVGRGVYTSASNSLTRATILSSSNANAAVNFSAGSKNVFVTAAAASLPNLIEQNTFAQGQITTSKPFTLTQQWNAAGVTFTGIFANYTDSASAAGSLLMDLQVGGATKAKIDKAGVHYGVGVTGSPTYAFTNATASGMGWRTSGELNFWVANNETMRLSTLGAEIFQDGIFLGSAGGVGIQRVSTNQIKFGSGTTLAISRSALNKEVTGIANATATDILTITIPNAAHSAAIKLLLDADLGAGGAIGACEAGVAAEYLVKINRTAGVNAVATISAVGLTTAANVAGAATATLTAAMSAVSGAVGASNTFTVKATISRSGGSSANHTCLVYAKLMNKNATGITIS